MGGARRASVSPFKKDALHGRVALITGGASGIGLEIARQLGMHGSKLIIMGRRLEVLQQAKQALEGEGVHVQVSQGDVRKPEDCQRAVQMAVQNFGKLDVLVNAAAGNFLAPAEDLSPKGFRTVIEIDTIGTFNACNAAFQELKKAADSYIINITMTLHYGASWYVTHACAAKAAVDALTRQLALEWGEYGIHVTGIAPGPIAGTTGMAKLNGGRSEEQMANAIPLRRYGTKFDIAMAAVFLISDAGTYINGHDIVVDGGSWLSRPPPADRETIRSFAKAVEKSSKNVGLAQQKSKL